ncbi:hypothetical protein K438DRAFT_1785611 [Mycena galopus ATCC 62051]|nr:hypothetical protein K438DRAFT_1785611 [Mycena galopus ATCC 62051]
MGPYRDSKDGSAILLDNFDIVHHLFTAKSTDQMENNIADNLPVSVPDHSPGRRLAPGTRTSRSQSPTRWSLRKILAMPSKSLDRKVRARTWVAEQRRRGTAVKACALKHMENAVPIQITTSTADYNVMSTGWAGICRNSKLNNKFLNDGEWSLKQLQAEFGMTQRNAHHWGTWQETKGSNYLRATVEAAEKIKEHRSAMKQAPGRRGNFHSETSGISFGGGQKASNGKNDALQTTVTRCHVDGLNLAWGWCSITALGNFDADYGGHLVLWDLKLVIRFPAGSTILLPSATLRHSNVGIAEEETRYSFTQFSAAGLFRWVDNGFKSDLTVNEEIASTNDLVTAAARIEARRT